MIVDPEYQEAREEFHQSDSQADSEEPEDVSRLVFDQVQDNTLADPTLHYTPFYCSRDHVYQEMGLSFITSFSMLLR